MLFKRWLCHRFFFCKIIYHEVFIFDRWYDVDAKIKNFHIVRYVGVGVDKLFIAIQKTKEIERTKCMSEGESERLPLLNRCSKIRQRSLTNSVESTKT